MRLMRSALAGLCLALLVVAPALAHHGDIHARCDGDQPVIKERPAGTEHVKVICRDGIPEFLVDAAPAPTFNPVKESRPQALPPDFGSWVTVWLNGHPLRTPYDPVRGVQEPGAYLAKSTGRVMMPVRFFTEAFGGIVDWRDSDQRVRLMMPEREKIMILFAGRTDAVVVQSMARLDQAPVIFQDRMFVPVRFLSEGFGAEVTWDHSNRSVRVELAGAKCVSDVYCGEVR